MQTSLPIPHSIGEVFWFAIAIFLASLGAGSGIGAVNLFLNRRRPAAEVRETDARAAKTLAETRSLDLQSNISAGDAVLRLVQQLAFSQMTIEKKNELIERLETENQAYEREIQWAQGVFKQRGISWDLNMD